MMKVYIITLIFPLIFYSSFALDFEKNLKIDLKGSYYWINEGPNSMANYPYYQWYDKLDLTQELHESKTVSLPTKDNPMRHAPSMIDLKINYKKFGFNVNADIVGEHRGVSYGTYSKDATVVYPKINLAFDTNVVVEKYKFEIGAAAGIRENLRLMEGLYFYNIDCQGIDFYIKYKKLKFQFFDIGDLVNQIGLNIDGAHHLILSYEDSLQNSKILYKASAANYDFDTYSGYTVSANIRTDKIKLYGQFARRIVAYSDVKNTAGLLTGIEYKDNFGGLSFNNVFEYRYYGSIFNKDHYQKNNFYRNENNSPYGLDYNNSIGPNLYPLNFYESPFSQWCVFTQYQNKNVIGLTYLLDAKYKFDNDLFIKTNVDLNYITASFSEPYLYKFITIALGWEPQRGNYVCLGATNKSMNLDMPFPTFYELSKLYFYLNFNVDLNIIGERKNEK